MAIDPRILQQIQNPTMGGLGRIGETLSKNREAAYENKRRDDENKRRQELHQIKMMDVGSKTALGYAKTMLDWDKKYRAENIEELDKSIEAYRLSGNPYPLEEGDTLYDAKVAATDKYEAEFEKKQAEVWSDLPDELKQFVPKDKQSIKALELGAEKNKNLQMSLHPKDDVTLASGAQRISSTGEVIAENKGGIENLISKVNPDSVTPESLEIFSKTRKYSDLEFTDKDSALELVAGIAEAALKRGASKGAEFYMKKLVEDMTGAQGAVKSIKVTNDLIDLMNDGINTGTFSDFQTWIGGAVKKLGFDIGDDTANTQAYSAYVGRQVAEIIKAFGAGTGLSDQDRKYALKIAGGEIDLTEDALRTLHKLNMKYSKMGIEQYNKDVKRVPEDMLGGIDFTIDIPEARDPLSKNQVTDIPSIKTEEEYNALESGKEYIDTSDGKTYRKP